ncbi:hypothetical protein BGZ73_000946, partial [Actinomortierella ambigua]
TVTVCPDAAKTQADPVATTAPAGGTDVTAVATTPADAGTTISAEASPEPTAAPITDSPIPTLAVDPSPVSSPPVSPPAPTEAPTTDAPTSEAATPTLVVDPPAPTQAATTNGSAPTSDVELPPESSPIVDPPAPTDIATTDIVTTDTVTTDGPIPTTAVEPPPASTPDESPPATTDAVTTDGPIPTTAVEPPPAPATTDAVTTDGPIPTSAVEPPPDSPPAADPTPPSTPDVPPPAPTDAATTENAAPTTDGSPAPSVEPTSAPADVPSTEGTDAAKEAPDGTGDGNDTNNFAKRQWSKRAQDSTVAEQAISECAASSSSIDYTQYKAPRVASGSLALPQPYCVAFANVCPTACQVILQDKQKQQSQATKDSTGVDTASTASRNGLREASNHPQPWNAECSWNGPSDQEAVLQLACNCGSLNFDDEYNIQDAEDVVGTCVTARMVEAAFTSVESSEQPLMEQAAIEQLEQPQQPPAPADQEAAPASPPSSSSGTVSALGNIDPSGQSAEGDAAAVCSRFATVCDATCHALFDSQDVSVLAPHMVTIAEPEQDQQEEQQAQSASAPTKRTETIVDDDDEIDIVQRQPTSSKYRRRHDRRAMDPAQIQESETSGSESSSQPRKYWGVIDLDTNLEPSVLSSSSQPWLDRVQILCNPRQLEARKCLCRPTMTADGDGLVMDLTESIRRIVE